MICIYEIYVDRYILKTTITNLVLLYLSLLLANRKIHFARMSIAALSGSMVSLIGILTRRRGGFLFLLLDLVEIIVMLLICIPKSSYNTKIKCLFIYMTMMSVMAAGVHLLTKICRQKEGIWIWKAGVFTLFYCIVIYYRELGRRQKRSVFQVCICAYGIKVQVKALLDTGNSLRDPMTGKMVSIIEERIAMPILSKKGDDMQRMIPYHSVGKEDGQIAIIPTDQITLEQDGEIKRIYGMLLGIYKGDLSSTGEFQMILHKDSFKEGKRNECNLSHLFTKTN